MANKSAPPISAAGKREDACGSGAAVGRKTGVRRASCFRMKPSQPNRAGFMFAESPSTWRGEIAATYRLAWPLALANLLQMLVHAVDVIFVARLGEQALAASSLSIALFG